jgi:hypothetical protein
MGKTMKASPSFLIVELACVLLSGCSKSALEETTKDAPIPVAKVEDHQPKSSSVSSKSTNETSSRSGVVEIEGVKFTIPAGWKRVDLTPAQSGFISARYLVPVDGEELQLTFSTAIGGIDANFDRWRGQFRLKPGVEPIQDLITLADGEAHWIDLRGTYTASTGFTSSYPESDVRMIGVGIPLADTAMYLKLLGPEPLVSQITDDMRSLVKSVDLP